MPTLIIMISSRIIMSSPVSPMRRMINNSAVAMVIQPPLSSQSTLTLLSSSAAAKNISIALRSLSLSTSKRRAELKTKVMPPLYNCSVMRRLSISKDDNDSATHTPEQQTNAFLLSLGYSHAVSKGIIDALVQNGIPPSSLLSMVKGLAGRYEVGEDAGLEALAASVKKELEDEQGKEKLKVWFLPSTGWSLSTEDNNGVPTIHSMDRAFSVEVMENTNLADVSRFGTTENCDVLREYLECACNGIMACSTCHIVIHPDWFDSTATSDEAAMANGVDETKIYLPSEPEQDMLDLAYYPQSTSRLGCQITLTKALDGMIVLLPKGSNNLMDSIPFE